ncbi:MAG: hypothetical protein KDD58_02500 [Bdellovibrionales bacterium]|nr:hypothetical protein [Bdellovibrionales bacterium]
MKLENRLLVMATIGAQLSFDSKGFRQKDVKFFAELFTNWMDTLMKPEVPLWHNTQAMRFLNQVTTNGYAKVTGAGKGKKYVLTRVGLLSLVQDLIHVEGYGDFRYTLLIYYFLKSYRFRIIEMIQRKSSGFSKVVQLEIEHLFDAHRFLSLQIEELKLQIKRLEVRVNEAQQASQLAEKMNNQNEPVNLIIDRVSALYPYELDNQKPMTELFKEIDSEQRLWELIDGNKYRSHILWKSQLEVLKSYLKVLNSL